MEQWRTTLRDARRSVGLTQPQLAKRVGASTHTIRSYERGDRRPPQPVLERIMAELKIAGPDANAVLEGAGYRPEPTLFPNWRFPNYFFSVAELPQHVGQFPWPCFVLDNNAQLIAANPAAGAVWRVDLDHELAARTRPQLNLMSVASDHHFADSVVNWDEVVSVIAGAFKGQPRRPESLDDPSAYLNAVLEEFSKGDRVFLQRFIDAWAKSPALEAKVRWTYRVVWRDPEFGDMRFLGLVTTASERDGLSFNDWHPVDAESWTVLDQVKRRPVPASSPPK